MDHISLRFVGNGVAPVTTRCKELAVLIAAAEEIVDAMTEEHREDDQIHVSLVSVEDQSLGLKFAAVQAAVALSVWNDLAAVVNTRKFETLPPKARAAFSEIVGFVKKRNCRAFLGSSQNETLATFDASFALPAELKFKGRSSLLGEVLRVGGEDPKVRLRLPSGKIFTCETKESVAKELGHRLYELVNCKGIATWDFTSNEVIRFRIEEVSDFTKVSASNAFESLAAALPAEMVSELEEHGFSYAN